MFEVLGSGGEKRVGKRTLHIAGVETKNGGIEKFCAGETSHPEYNEIKKALDDLLNRLQNMQGYQPNLNSVDYDVGDEEKMHILLAHSEKLALSYALLGADSGSTIKIIKNIKYVIEDVLSCLHVWYVHQRLQEGILLREITGDSTTSKMGHVVAGIFGDGSTVEPNLTNIIEQDLTRGKLKIWLIELFSK